MASEKLKGFIKITVAVIAGALVTLALPPYNILLPLFFSFPILLFLIDKTSSLTQAFWIGWAFGFGNFVTGLYWISYSLLVEPDKFAWLIPFAISLVPAVLAVYIGLVAVFMGFVQTRAYSRVIIFAAAWTILEILRGNLFTGFPWNLIGYVWSDNLAVLQSTSLFGIYGLSFVSIVIFSAPYAFFTAHKDRKFGRVAPVLVIIGLLTVMWGWGDYRIKNNPTEYTDTNVHLIQANIKQHLKWDENQRFGNFMTHIDLSQDVIKGQDTENEKNYFVWSETSIPYLLEKEPALLELIEASLPDNSYVFTGALRAEREEDDYIRVWNSLYTIKGNGEIVGNYDKSRLVPFGEFVPFRRFLPSFVKKITHGTSDFSSGEGSTTIKIDGVEPFSPLICYEIIFPEYVVNKDKGRPSWLLNVTNDAWFGESSGPYQHLAMARVRSIEYGVPLIRVANTGVSAVVDSYGRVVGALKLNERGTISSKMPSVSGNTIYSGVGIYLILIFSVGLILCFLITRRI